MYYDIKVLNLYLKESKGKKMSDEAKTTKTIRDYEINQTNPFDPASSNYLSKDKALAVSIDDSNSRSLTGIHKISKDEALDLIGDVLKEKLGITKGGVLVFKYLFSNLEKEESSEEYSMTFKVDFDHCKDEIGWASTQSVWYGLAELLDKAIVARSGVPGVYFLNPNFFLPKDTIVISEFYKLKED